MSGLLWTAGVSAFADCNGNGVADAVDVESGFSEDCNGNRIPDECEHAPVTLGLGGSFSVGRIPRVAVAADFDGDGITDLATGNQDSDFLSTSTVSVLLSRGDGTFDPAVDFAAGRVLSFMTARDLDDDGHPDLATANFDRILVFKNRGDGTFDAAVELAAQKDTRFVVASDVTGDGAPDLVTTSTRAGTVSVFENQGDGRFAAPVSFRAGMQPTSVAPADLDGDGNVDLAVTDRESGAIFVLLGRGDGSFVEAASYAAGGAAPFAVLAVDLDGDGDLDLAVASPTAVSVLPGDGTGAFGPPISHAAVPTSFASGDFDGDGDLDLAFGSDRAGSVTVLVNDGSGNFTAVSFRVRGVRWAISAADLDGDADVDLAVSIVNPDRVAILWNEDERSALSFQAGETFAAGGDPHTLALGDLDGDGDVDLVTGNNNEGISVLLGEGDGSFASPRRVSSGDDSFSIVLADLDGDADLDLASADLRSSRIQVLENSGHGDFVTVRNFGVGGKPFHVTAADLDADGSIDLISSNRSTNTVSLLLGAGDGTFGSPRNIPVGIAPVATAAADLDGDGDIDLAVANQGSSDVSILTNLGGGTFAEPVNYPAPASPSFVTASDLDLDGHVDLVTASESGRSVSVLWNAGDRPFEIASRVPIDQRPYSLIVIDLDDDGRPDVVTANQQDDNLSILVNRCERSFYPPVEYPVRSGPRFVFARDLDGDDALDLISANHHSADITVLLNQSPRPAGDYLVKICTELDFHNVAVSSGGSRSRELVTKYVLPSRGDPALLPTVFQNAQRHPLHEEFLRKVFPERFGALTPGDYERLVGRRASRDYYAGTVARVPEDGGFAYAFTVVADTGFDQREGLKPEEVEWVYERLSDAFRLGPLCYRPDTRLARREIEESWPHPAPVPICSGDVRPDFGYEAYSVGVAYGRVRGLTLAEFEDGNEAGRFTFQDILVVDEAPRDVEGIVAALITGAPQGKLSHTTIRLARRGTPNAYLEDALKKFARFEGALVRLEVCEGAYTVVDEVAPEEADKFWAANRPEPPDLPGIDAEYRALDHLLEIELNTVNGVPAEARFGGKAANFARLQGVLVGRFAKYRESGFAIPMAFYLDFLRGNSIRIESRDLTYDEYLRELVASREFQTDSRVRFETLRSFRKFARRYGVVSPELIARLAARIPEVFGSATRMVRFRSSSNIEDALEFNGAGLYESTSVCAADTLDPDDRDGSHCDPTRDNERTIERALKKVWASLWTFRAFEERDYFQISQESAAMGILVTRAFLDETANGVAFTGNPRDSGDHRYVISVQPGEESVVSPEPDVVAERNLLEVVDGEVTNIVRERGSSLLPPDQTVLSDEQLGELGAFMSFVEENFPLDLEGDAREEVLLDFEFKIEPDGSLAVKQVRPFLLPAATARSPTFELVIPPGTTVCGVFSKERTGREPRDEYAAKSTVHFVAGTLELPAGSSQFSGDLFEEVRFGPRQELAVPQGSGLFQVTRTPKDCKQTKYRFNYRQSFVLPGGDSLEITLFGLEFTGQGGRAPDGALVLDEEFLTSELSMQGTLAGVPVVSYSSCGYELLPLWKVEVALEGGSFIRLEERFLPSENNVSTGPASLVRAEVELDGASQSVTDYWRLVYAAERHNRHVRYWVVLDPPLDVAGTGSPVHAIEIRAPEPTAGVEAAEVLYLGESFEVLERSGVRDYDARRIDKPAERLFLRGDVNADGNVNLADAVELLGVLFRGKPSLCVKAADADDNGRVNLSDAVRILLHLFGGEGPLPTPSESCGVDPTPDGLGCVSPRACER